MKLSGILTSLSRVTGRTGLVLKKASPEILIVGGIVGVVGSTIMACKATLKVDGLLDEHHNKVDKINGYWQRVEDGEVDKTKYTEEDKKKDLVVTYTQTAVSFIKLYAGPVILGVLSIGCILGGHNITRRRNVALMAAYKAIQEGFNAYRKRVIADHGADADYAYKHGLKREEVVETETDKETGEVKEVKKTKFTADGDPNKLGTYARYFDETCASWGKNAEYNLLFLKNTQRYFNDLLQARGHVFLNEVLDALGIPRTGAGQVVGWVLDRNDKTSDGYIDFGVFDANNERARAFVNGNERSILLDFNCDGTIYNRI